MRKRKLYYQYNFSDVYGKSWRTEPENPYGSEEGQLNIEDCYDKSVLGEETSEERVRRQMKGLPQCRIMNQRIISGDYVESNIYPVFLNRKDVPRCPKARESREAQKSLNKKNRQKKIIRLIHCNFKKGDLLMTLTYEDGYYPTLERARKDVGNYLKAIARYRKKQGMPALKYIYVIEYVPEGEHTRKVRIHHHVIMNAMDRDIAESKWKKGRRQSRYADPDSDFGMEGFARYISKLESDGKHLWQASRNLKKPVIQESVTALTRKKMRDMVMAGDALPEMMEKLYRGTLRHIDTKIYYSDWVGGFYIYSRLKKKEVESVEEKENASSGRHLKQAKIYLDNDWEGTFANGMSCYSTVLEAEAKGLPWTKEIYGCVSGTTKNRAVLYQLIQALERFKEPCEIEVHTESSYLHTGLDLNRFERARAAGYSNTKNADLIARLLELTPGHRIQVIKTEKNKYSDAEQIQRRIKRREMEAINDER